MTETILNILFAVTAVILCGVSHKIGYYEGWKEGIKTEHGLIREVLTGTIEHVTGEKIDV